MKNFRIKKNLLVRNVMTHILHLMVDILKDHLVDIMKLMKIIFAEDVEPSLNMVTIAITTNIKIEISNINSDITYF
jgi:hypothetical protein